VKGGPVAQAGKKKKTLSPIVVGNGIIPLIGKKTPTKPFPPGGKKEKRNRLVFWLGRGLPILRTEKGEEGNVREKKRS